jgi:ankyrin repeat protein
VRTCSRLIGACIAGLVALAASPSQADQVPPIPNNPEFTLPDEVRERDPKEILLLEGAMLGRLDDVRKALADGVNIEATADSGATALLEAAGHGHLEIVDALLAAGAKGDATDQTGATAIMFAASQGHTSIVRALATRGADVNARDSNGLTALMAAASSNRLETVRALLDLGANPNASDRGGATSLMAAAFGAHTDVGRLLIARGADVNATDAVGRTALMATALSGDAALAEALLTAKANVAAADQGGLTALAYAASNGRAAIVALVTKAGLTTGLDAALSFAVRGCHTDIVRVLEASGAKLDTPIQGQPPIVLAASSNCPETLTFLLDKGVNPDTAADKGITPLMAAAAKGLIPIADILVARGANLEARDADDRTAWFHAAMNGHQEFVEMLRKIRDTRPPQ